MNRVVIFFVPPGVEQHDFENMLREDLVSSNIEEARPQMEMDQSAVRDPDQSPLWTWFLPNPPRKPHEYEHVPWLPPLL